MNLTGRKNEYALHSRAHRHDLAPPRKIDKQFQLFWVQIQAALDDVLDKFETRAAEIRAKLDELLNKSEPSKQDIDFLRLCTPNATFAQGYFFEHLTSVAWLQPLYESGFFDHPPNMESTPGGKELRIPVWFQSRYLVSVASQAPELVVEIAIKLLNGETDNTLIHEDLAEAMLKVPPDLCAYWVKAAIKWLGRQKQLHFQLPEAFGKLINYLANADEIEVAILLAKKLLFLQDTKLDVLTDSQSGFRFDEYEYERIVEEYLPNLIKSNTEAGLKLLCEILQQHLTLNYSNQDSQIAEDFSYLWCSNLAQRRQNLHGFRSLLATKIWELSSQIAQDSSKVRILIVQFQSYHWRIFDRLSLFLMRRFSDSISDLIIDRLSRPARLGWLGTDLYEREYALLLKEQFPQLPASLQSQILQRIVEDPIALFEGHVNQRDKVIKIWRREWLSVVEASLPPHLRQLLNTLVQELGTAESLEDARQEISVRSGPESPKSSAELVTLAENNLDGLFSYLRDWEPSDGFFTPSKNGLAQEVAIALITPYPQRFVNQIEQFKTLDSIFMVCLLQGLKKSLNRQNKEHLAFEWQPVLTFCDWLLCQLQEIRDRSCSQSYDEWSRICDAIIGLIDAGLIVQGTDRIAQDLYDQVWRILNFIVNDTQVTPGFDLTYRGSNGDPYDVSLNAVRCRALYTIVQYAFWRRQDSSGNVPSAPTFEGIEEVETVLTQHLDPTQDPSLAIRAVYGNQFLRLHHLSSSWARQHLNHIFPEASNSTIYFEAAWDGYIYSSSAGVEIFQLLRQKYSYAIRKLLILKAENYASANASNAIAVHLLDLFWHNQISLGDSDALLENFFRNAPENARQEFTRNIGWRLVYGGFEVDIELGQRLQSLIQWRVEQIENDALQISSISDLQFFSWWFTSGKLDNQWLLNYLLKIFKLLGDVKQFQGFLNRLAAIADEFPTEVIQCLELILACGASSQWFTHYRKDCYQSILQVILSNSDSVTQEAARNFINRLLARSLYDFRALLVEHKIPEAI